MSEEQKKVEITDGKLQNVTGGMYREGMDTCFKGRKGPDSKVCPGCTEWGWLAGDFGIETGRYGCNLFEGG